MFNQNEYESFKLKYGNYSSWAIWNYTNPNDTEIIDQQYDQLHSKYVLLGLNISRQLDTPPWSNFHDNTHSRKIKYACNDTILRGSYITDIFKDMVDPSSTNFEKLVTKDEIDRNVGFFNQEMMDIQLKDETKFIIFGSSALHYYKKYFKQDFNNEIIHYRHYSSRGTDKEWVTGFWDKLSIRKDYDEIVKKYIA